jgi:hypothetical protein
MAFTPEEFAAVKIGQRVGTVTGPCERPKDNAGTVTQKLKTVGASTSWFSLTKTRAVARSSKRATVSRRLELAGMIWATQRRTKRSRPIFEA